MLKSIARGLMARKLRLLLTALSIALGVAFVAGTFILTDTLNHTFDELFADTTQGIDAAVRAKSDFDTQPPPVPEDLLGEVREIDGVEFAGGTVSGYAQLVDKDGEAIGSHGAGPPTIGLAWPEGFPSSSLVIRAGRPPRADGEVVIDAASANEYGFAVGDDVEVLLQGPSETFTVVGITGFGDADNLAGATLAVFDLDTAQRVLDKKAELDAIDVAAEEGVSSTELVNRLEASLPDRYEAITAGNLAEENADAVQEGLGFFQTFLLIFAAIALFVGSFIIFNTFSITIAQRMRELALIRTLGATARQVMASVVIEALVIGLVASLVGLGLGFGVAVGLQALLAGFGVDLPSTDTQFLPRTVIVSLLLGTVITIVASIGPARRAAKVPPIAALRDAAPREFSASRKRIGAGVVVAVAGGAALAIGLVGGGDQALTLIGIGAATFMIGISVLSPLFVRPLARIVSLPIQRTRGLAGRLAADNSMRNPQRTATTAAALMIGLAMVAMSATFAASLKASAAEVIDDTFRADYVVTTETFGVFSADAASQLGNRDEVAVAMPLRFGEVRVDKTQQFVTAINPGQVNEVINIEMVGGSIKSATRNAVTVQESTAESKGLELGDRVTMTFPRRGAQDLEVVGIHQDNPLVDEYVISIDTYEANFTEHLDSVVFIKGSPGVSPDRVGEAVDETIARWPNLEARDQAEFKQQQSAQVNQLLGLVYALLGLAVVIAMFGIVNTLALSIFERTRELGLLRAVGMTRSQVRSTIRWESVIISVLGALFGIVVGVAFGWAIVSAVEEITALVLPGSQLLLFVVLAALLGIIAAIGPARRASKVDVLRAVTVE